MKNMKKVIACICAMALVLVGCANSKQAEKKGERKLQVYASFYPIAEFTKQIVQDKMDVKTIIENGEEPHDFELSTKQAAQLTKADLIIYNGAKMETWIDALKQSAPKPTYVDTSVGIDLIKEDENTHHEEGEHYHEINPHIWLSLKNAQKQLATIKDAIIKKDPTNQKFYEENFEQFVKSLQALDAEYAKQLKDTKLKTIVVSHEAYSYLAKDYGLKEESISGFSPEAEPSLAKLAQLKQLVEQQKVKTIFFDENATSKVSEVLAKEANVKTSILYTLEKEEENQDYITIMKKNLEILVKALNE